MSSPVRAYLHSLPNHQISDDCVIKIASAQDLIGSLPINPAIPRDLSLVPDVPVRIILSTGNKLPSRIQSSCRDDKLLMTDNHLLGMALNGRGTHPEIFLHDWAMSNLYAEKKQLFDEIAWHEILHSLEDLTVDANGMQSRPSPWSYDLQQRMLALDQDHGAGMPIEDMTDEKHGAFLRYLRKGTKMQENVSEVFARVGVLFLQEIRDQGILPVKTRDFIIPDLTRPFNQVAAKNDLLELRYALMTYGPNAKQVFWQEFPQMVERISSLSGIRLSLS